VADRRPGEDRQPTPRRRTAAEWTTLGVSAAIIAALVGVAVYEHLARAEPAGVRVSVRLETERAERRGEAYYVPFVVVNAGAEPAEAVSVAFEVRRGEEVLEESTIEIAFLANSGSEEGELVTRLDPAAHEIEARVGALLRP
jgi:uncharacterized protein (TIGR02588 family)